MNKQVKRWLYRTGVFLASLTMTAGSLTAVPAAVHADTTTSSTSSSSSTNSTTDYTVNAKAAIAIDATTGQVLYAKNANTKLAIASISKIITVGVIEQEIKAGKLSWNTKVKVTKEEAKLSENTEYSNITLTAGKSYTVKELTEAAMIKSADAAAITLSRATGDSTASFVKKMQAFVKKAGVTDAKLYNQVGLTNSQMGSYGLKGVAKNAENEMTATDVAKIAQYLIKNYPSLLNITKLTSTTIDGTTVTTINKMLAGQSDAPTQVKIDGLKTGTSDKAGACFVSTGTYQGHRIITVVLHATGGGDERFTQTANLYRLIANEYTAYTVQPRMAATVPNGKVTTTTLTTQGKITLWKKDGTLLSPSLAINSKAADKNGKLTAPVKKGQVVGELTYAGLTGLDGNKLTVDVVPTTNVDKANVFVRMGRWVKSHI
ncbi:D-alanyl-D-alanine carboxypeptidase [Limosilactobacillus fermentum]